MDLDVLHRKYLNLESEFKAIVTRITPVLEEYETYKALKAFDDDHDTEEGKDSPGHEVMALTGEPVPQMASGTGETPHDAANDPDHTP